MEACCAGRSEPLDGIHRFLYRMLLWKNQTFPSFRSPASKQRTIPYRLMSCYAHWITYNESSS